MLFMVKQIGPLWISLFSIVSSACRPHKYDDDGGDVNHGDGDDNDAALLHTIRRCDKKRK